ncbi:hypothetical protein QR98_0038480 [Sarcoptes scabiei]|uniref:Uncharacterized protein n=1 Tax=Sarcoptes scabiei TaxID=52283 RepID=A0A132A2Y9_SARSC|nr:hypothetical protein QR98_0038480 [Sarcoptes scabiei]
MFAVLNWHSISITKRSIRLKNVFRSKKKSSFNRSLSIIVLFFFCRNRQKNQTSEIFPRSFGENFDSIGPEGFHYLDDGQTECSSDYKDIEFNRDSYLFTGPEFIPELSEKEFFINENKMNEEKKSSEFSNFKDLKPLQNDSNQIKIRNDLNEDIVFVPKKTIENAPLSSVENLSETIKKLESNINPELKRKAPSIFDRFLRKDKNKNFKSKHSKANSEPRDSNSTFNIRAQSLPPTSDAKSSTSSIIPPTVKISKDGKLCLEHKSYDTNDENLYVSNVTRQSPIKLVYGRVPELQIQEVIHLGHDSNLNDSNRQISRSESAKNPTNEFGEKSMMEILDDAIRQLQEESGISPPAEDTVQKPTIESKRSKSPFKLAKPNFVKKIEKKSILPLTRSDLKLKQNKNNKSSPEVDTEVPMNDHSKENPKADQATKHFEMNDEISSPKSKFTKFALDLSPRSKLQALKKQSAIESEFPQAIQTKIESPKMSPSSGPTSSLADFDAIEIDIGVPLDAPYEESDLESTNFSQPKKENFEARSLAIDPGIDLSKSFKFNSNAIWNRFDEMKPAEDRTDSGNFMEIIYRVPKNAKQNFLEQNSQAEENRGRNQRVSFSEPDYPNVQADTISIEREETKIIFDLYKPPIKADSFNKNLNKIDDDNHNSRQHSEENIDRFVCKVKENERSDEKMEKSIIELDKIKDKAYSLGQSFKIKIKDMIPKKTSTSESVTKEAESKYESNLKETNLDNRADFYQPVICEDQAKIFDIVENRVDISLDDDENQIDKERKNKRRNKFSFNENRNFSLGEKNKEKMQKIRTKAQRSLTQFSDKLKQQKESLQEQTKALRSKSFTSKRSDPSRREHDSNRDLHLGSDSESTPKTGFGFKTAPGIIEAKERFASFIKPIKFNEPFHDDNPDNINIKLKNARSRPLPPPPVPPRPRLIPAHYANYRKQPETRDVACNTSDRNSKSFAPDIESTDNDVTLIENTKDSICSRNTTQASLYLDARSHLTENNPSNPILSEKQISNDGDLNPSMLDNRSNMDANSISAIEVRDEENGEEILRKNLTKSETTKTELNSANDSSQIDQDSMQSIKPIRTDREVS